MRNVILFAISLTLALVAAAIAAEAQSDIDLFQGTWKFTKTVEDGAGAPPPPDAAAIGFESNKMLDVQGGHVQTRSIQEAKRNRCHLHHGSG
jgi:hypothetical protein